MKIAFRAHRLVLKLMLAVAALLLSHNIAQAQSLGDKAMGPIGGVTGAKGPTKSVAPASALPGENAGSDRVIPAEHSAADMSPTDALFDAVVRGDLPAARDAIARGADFTASNELGQTPLDESIDLGRNNITFMLLSLRGGPNDAAPAAIASKPVKAAPAPQPRATVVAASPAPSPAPAPKPSVAQVATPAPALVSGNPGTPKPQNGFLGFGG